MDPSLTKEIVILCLFLIVLLCVLIPLKFAETAQRSGIDIFNSQRYSSVVSILNCFAAGIFLGTCLLHLFPDVRETIDAALENSNPSFPIPEFTIALGFFMLLTIEQIISAFRESSYGISDTSERLPILSDTSEQLPIPSDTSEQLPIISDTANNGVSQQREGSTTRSIVNHEQNATIRVIALIMALSIHSIFEGIAIGVQNTTESVLQITGAIIIHKIVIAFSLGLTLTQSPLGWIKSLFCGLIFAAASPMGIGIGLVVTKLEALSGSLAVGVLQGLAAGTFLYVTFLEVLPHEFKSGHLHLPKLISFILGFSVICLALLLFPDN